MEAVLSVRTRSSAELDPVKRRIGIQLEDRRSEGSVNLTLVSAGHWRFVVAVSPL